MKLYKKGATYGFLLIALIMLLLNTFCYIAQQSVTNIASEYGGANQNVPLGDNSFMRGYMTNTSGNTSEPVLTRDLASQLPSSTGGVASSIGIFFFPIVIFLGWISSFTGFIYGFVMAVPNMIASLGLPAVLSFPLSVLWFAFAVISLIIGVLK